LERNGIVDSVKEDAKARAACPKELKEFESVCASSWVSLKWIFLMNMDRERLKEVLWSRWMDWNNNTLQDE
jgi:hypothetical protein